MGLGTRQVSNQVLSLAFLVPEYPRGRSVNMVVFEKREIVSAEEKRLNEDREHKIHWKKWGSYVAERQWATGGLLTALSWILTHSLTRAQPVKTIRMLFLL